MSFAYITTRFRHEKGIGYSKNDGLWPSDRHIGIGVGAGVDIGAGGKAAFREHILGCKTILWNGPVGVFEINKFSTGSKAVADAIAEATKNGAFSLIGGGDSVACVNKFGLGDEVSYISTGGGALLEYIEFGDLPGVAAIRD